MNSAEKVNELRKYLNYARLLAIAIVLYILLDQQYILYSQIAPMKKSLVIGKDYITQQEMAFNLIKKDLPPKGVYRYEADYTPDHSEFLMHYNIAQYSLAPRVLTDSLFT